MNLLHSKLPINIITQLPMSTLCMYKKIYVYMILSIQTRTKFILKVLKMKMTNWFIFMVDSIYPSLSFSYDDLQNPLGGRENNVIAFRFQIIVINHILSSFRMFPVR